MRLQGLHGRYDEPGASTRSQPMTRDPMPGCVDKLALPEDERTRLRALPPASYSGLAAQLARGLQG